MSDGKNVVASVLARLRNQARTEGTPFGQILQLYAMERFLYRLSRSPHVDAALLKGALLLRTVGIPRARPTLDIDLLRHGRADRESLVALVRDCALIDDSMNDGVRFDPASIVSDDIARGSPYQGTRLTLNGRMDNVRLHVQIDIGVGDAVVPGPQMIEYPALLQQPPVRLLACPIETAIAEKYQAMVALDAANSRMKDFYDIWSCSQHLQFDGELLARAIAATFARRSTLLPTEPPLALTAVFYDDRDHRVQWNAFVKRIGEVQHTDSLEQIANSIREFLMPPTYGAGSPGAFACSWKPQGPWQQS